MNKVMQRGGNLPGRTAGHVHRRPGGTGTAALHPSDALEPEAGEPPQAGKQRGRKQARRYADTVKTPEDSTQSPRFDADRQQTEGGKTSRLRFTKEERRQAGEKPTDNATGPEPSGAAGDSATEKAGSDTGDPGRPARPKKAKRRLDKATRKAGEARDNLPTQRRVQLKKELDGDTGRPRRRLRFETEVKPEGRRNPLARGALRWPDCGLESTPENPGGGTRKRGRGGGPQGRVYRRKSGP